MRILITGGSGFLGVNLIKELIQQGHTPISLSRTHHHVLDELKVLQIKADLTNDKILISACEGIDAIFHLASKVGMWGHYKDFYQTNVLGTKNILHAAQINKVKYFIYTSSPSVVFGKKNLKAVDESTPYPKEHLNFYAKTKTMAEKMVLDANTSITSISSKTPPLFTCALRPHLIYGPNEPHMIPRLIDRAKKNKLKIIGDGANKVDVTHISNAVQAHLLALTKLIKNPQQVGGSSFFIANKNPVILWNFINTILKDSGLKPIKQKIAFPLAYSIGAVCEGLYKILGIYHRDPPMTRFVAMQMSKDHYFTQDKARQILDYNPDI